MFGRNRPDELSDSELRRSSTSDLLTHLFKYTLNIHWHVGTVYIQYFLLVSRQVELAAYGSGILWRTTHTHSKWQNVAK